MWRHAVRGAPRASLRVKLVAVALCLLAAGAAVIVTVGASALRGQLIRQAGDQLRVYANQLASNSFQLLGTYQGARTAFVPFNGTGPGGDARAPGTAERVGAAGAVRTPGASATSSSPSTVGVLGGSGTVVTVSGGPKDYSVELRGPGGQLLLSTGPGTQAGQALPKPFAPVPPRAGVLRTVRGVGGSYLVIAEPVHFTTRRLAFGYGADDFAISGGSRTSRTAQTGTLVVGLPLASIDQPVRRLTLLAVAVSAAAIVIVGGLGWAAIRFSLRPLTRAAQTADAAAAGMASDGSGLRPVPERPADDMAGDLAGPADDLAGGLAAAGGLAQAANGLAGSLNTSLRKLDSQFTASVDAEAAAHAATGQLAARLESVAETLRRPISLLHGRAEHWAHRDGRRNGDQDRAVTQIVGQVAGAEALLDELDDARD